MSSPVTVSGIFASTTDLIATGVLKTIDAVAPSEPIFLQTTLAKAIAGTFVWAALFLTCQQVLHVILQ